MLAPQKDLTDHDLMQGAWFALEQCGLLLEASTQLYRTKMYGTAVVWR